MGPKGNDVLVMRKIADSQGAEGGVTRLELSLQRTAGGAGTPAAHAAAAPRAPDGADDEGDHSESEWEDDESFRAGGLLHPPMGP